MRTLVATTLLVALLAMAAVAHGGELDDLIASVPDDGDRVVRVAQGAPWGATPLPQYRSNVRGPGWSWEITPWLYAASLDGDVTVDGRKESVATGYGDLFGDTASNVGLGLDLEIWEADAGFLFNLEWLSQGDESGGVETRTDQADMEIGIGYRFGQVAQRRAGRSQWSTAEFQILARWIFLKQEITEGRFALSDRADWWEVVFAFAGDFRIAKRWEIGGRWDIAGFAIGTSSNIHTNLLLNVGFEVTENVVVKLGYRVTYLDYSRGSGSNELAFEAFRHGIVLGAGFRF